MKFLVVSAFSLVMFSNLYAEEMPDQVYCQFGNAQARPGPGYRGIDLGKLTPSKTTALIVLGDFWKTDGQIISTNSAYFQFGAVFTADELRKAVWSRMDDISNEVLLDAQKLNPSAIEFEVVASLSEQQDAILVSVSRKANPFNLRTRGGAFGDRTEGKIDVKDFGKPHLFGDVGIVCTGKSLDG